MMRGRKLAIFTPVNAFINADRAVAAVTTELWGHVSHTQSILTKGRHYAAMIWGHIIFHGPEMT